MKRLIFGISVVTALSVAVTVVSAQPTLEGKLTRMTDFATTDMVNLSQYNYGFSTARSSAMAGAFTSLGADLSSMGINPAGLGMYRGSEIGISMSIMSSNTDSKVGGGYSRMNDKTKFALNNLGIAFNVYQGTGSLTSFTLGFGYNKLADFNYNTGVRLADDKSSINQVFLQQLNHSKYNESILGSSKDPFNNYNIDVLDWGAVLGYQTRVLDPVAGSTNEYYMPGWTPATNTTHFLNTINKGSVGEYSLSGGMNFNNIFYLGFSLGLQDIYYEQMNYYDEQYPDNAEDMRYMLYDQRVKLSGSGVNFKLGAVVRPMDGLRIGVAIHTPTYVSLDRSYGASMSTKLSNETETATNNRSTTDLIYDYKFNSPTRLLTGVSYTMPNVGIISVDYERVWYNGMRLSGESGEIRDDWKSAVKGQYQGANNVRAGLEVKPLAALALRAGYAYYGSVTKDDDRVFDQPITTKGYNLSAGIGYRYKSMSVDFAYIYMNSTLSAYDLYSYSAEGNTPPITTSQYIETTRTRNNFTLSLGVKF